MMAITILIFVGIIYYIYKSDHIFSKILSILLTVAILLLIPKVSELSDTLSNITGLGKETNTVLVITQLNNDYDSIEDVKDMVFGANTTQDAFNVQFAQEEIQKKIDATIHIKRYTEYDTLVEDFNNQSPEVFIISESHLDFLYEIDESIETNYKIIATYSYSTDLEVPDDVNVSTETFTIFISGIDTGGDISSVSRSDANIILTINPIKHQILMTSIPRDTYVIRHTNGKYDKLSLVGLSGVTETVKTIEDLMEMDIDYTLRVNWTSVVKVVDALGGIEVNSPYAFRQGQHYFTKGMNQLDGEKALAFVRNRKSLPDDEDSRAQNQQLVLTAIINKMMSPAIITNYSNFLNAISDSVQITMPKAQLNILISNQLNDMPNWEIFTNQIVGEMFDTWVAYSHMGIWQIVKEPNAELLENAKELITKMHEDILITDDMILK